MANENIRDAFLAELKGRRKEHTPLYVQMLGWKNVNENPKEKIIRDVRKKELEDAIR